MGMNLVLFFFLGDVGSAPGCFSVNEVSGVKGAGFMGTYLDAEGDVKYIC